LSSIQIPETHRRDATFGQPLIALAIGGFVADVCVLAPIKLNREPQQRAIEIQNKRAGRMLPPKIYAELSISELLP
jgi:hypothetical protein